MLTRQSEQGPHHSQKGDVCHTRRLRTFSEEHSVATVSNGCNIVPTLQRCVTLEMADANRPLKTSNEVAFIARACIPLSLSSLPAPPKFNNFAPNIVHPQSTTTFVINRLKPVN